MTGGGGGLSFATADLSRSRAAVLSSASSHSTSPASSGTRTGTRRPTTRSRWVGRAAVLPTSPFASQTLKLIVVSLSMLGLQLVWSCEMAQASPYLLSLGVSKAMMSVVFVAGPLSGLIVQPVVGVLSDGCRSSLGRRRPFIIAGCAVSSLAVVLLGWSGQVAGWFTTHGSSVHSHLTIALAVLSIYLIDFSINVVQAMDRALLVDVIPPNLQEGANAWASRMVGFGAVFGYWFGGLDLVYWSNGYLGDNQLKVICIFTAFFLCGSHAITVACVQERVLISCATVDDATGEGSKGPVAMLNALQEIWTTIKTLPRPIQEVVSIQFTLSLAWYPIMFFSTTWVAETYLRSLDGGGSIDLGSVSDKLRDDATRSGTRAMLFHSIVALTTSILLPPFVASSAASFSSPPPQLRHPPGGSSFLDRLTTTWRRFAPTLPLPWLSLPLLWTLSNGLFGILLLSTYLSSSVFGASFIIAAVGFCGAITQWAPFALLGELILSLGANSTSLHPVQLDYASAGDIPTSTWVESRPSFDENYQSSYDDTPKPSYAFQPHSTTTETEAEVQIARFRSSTTSTIASSLGSPNSATSAYFEAVMDTPTFPPTPFHPHSRSSTTEMTGLRNKTLTPPPRKDLPSPLRIVMSPVARQPNHIDVDLFSSHPYNYPLHADEASSQLTLLPGDGMGSRSATPLRRGSANSPLQVLQVRHSDDESSESSCDSGEENPKGRGRKGIEDETGNDETHGGRRGTIKASDGNGLPIIRVGEGQEGWDEERAGEDPRDTLDGEDDDDMDGAADQAGAILGIHNIYVVMPQFLVTALSSIIFALFAPHQPIIHHGGSTTHPIIPADPATASSEDPLTDQGELGEHLIRRVVSTTLSHFVPLLTRASDETSTGGDQFVERQYDPLGMIFQFGGFMALISAYLAWKMTRHWNEREREARLHHGALRGQGGGGGTLMRSNRT
ncbi:BQ2448_3737 [Microbotryum intermedium]|uniref:BQ2448_3737 protein n=1 Tax=Microbotryum intermedium TaxID=269621 RepID=A0A238FCQ5_9BASI|nr:BQ2448_3737 [Microbotryum intermedium]